MYKLTFGLPCFCPAKWGLRQLEVCIEVGHQLEKEQLEAMADGSAEKKKKGHGRTQGPCSDRRRQGVGDHGNLTCRNVKRRMVQPVFDRE